MSGFLGFDTSNYTTSVAVFDNGDVIQKKRLLPVKEGERGIRQSDAVFHHTKAYAELLESVLASYSGEIKAVGASITPTTQEGSYMPCFLVGENAAGTVVSALNVPAGVAVSIGSYIYGAIGTLSPAKMVVNQTLYEVHFSYDDMYYTHCYHEVMKSYDTGGHLIDTTVMYKQAIGG